MIRQRILTGLVILTVVFLSGCSDDFLKEKKVFDKLGDLVYNSEETTQQILDFVYYNTFKDFNAPNKVDAPNLGWSTDFANCTPEQGGSLPNWIKPSVTAEALTASECPNGYGTSVPTSIADNFYTRIRTCNLVIKDISDGNALKPDAKSRILGQAYFLRARQYFQLIRTHGGIPYVTKPQYAGEAGIQMKRTPTSQCVELMCEDLDSAAAHLPGRWSDPTVDWGKPTRGTALAYKSRILLWWASPVMNPDYSTDASRWQDALDAGLAAERQLVADNFGLYGENNPGSNGSTWANMFKAYDQENMEGIWMKIHSTTTGAGSSGWESSIRLSPQGGGSGMDVPIEMVNLFPLADGSRPTATNGYDPDYFFLDRDPRFYRTFAFPGTYWDMKSLKTGESKDIWTYSWYRTPEDEFNLLGERQPTNRNADNIGGNSSVKVRKMSADEKMASSSYALSGVDFMEYRFAELLLNIAESYAGVGDFSKCSEYLGRIRKRAGIPQGSNNYGIGTLSSKPKAFESCLYERSVELAYEGKRFFDISRWMLYEGGPSGRVNTCTYLGVAPLNGTARTGLYYYVVNEDNQTYFGEDDPFLFVEGNVNDIFWTERPTVANPDDPNFAQQLAELKPFYQKYLRQFKYNLWDKEDGLPATITWKEKCYIFGLNKSTLTYNAPYLEQNTGWSGVSDSEMGKFDPLL